ncbi:MAG TPA: RluA family pseudouridine synthase [Stenomitos sp.]
MEPQVLTVPPEAKGERLDQFLHRHIPTLSRSRLQELIEAGSVLLNGKPAKPSLKLKGGEAVQYEIPAPRELAVAAEAIPLDVVYEDSDLIVINKPQGMVTHPAPGAWEGTLVNALLAHCQDLSGIGGVARPGIVHRLDKDTSGLLVVAKNDAAHQALSAQIAAKTAKRQYLTVVHGVLPTEGGSIEAPIARHPTERIKMAVVPGGRPALTHWRVLESFPDASLVEVTLATGRTHQIRVHMAHLGHPVVGDPVYGPKVRFPVKLEGQALHAFRLAFDHPTTGERLEFEVPPPERFQTLLRYLRSRS